MIARENGLEPLIDAILADRAPSPRRWRPATSPSTVKTVKEALDGARDILMERLAENAALLGELRAFMKAEAFLTSKVVAGQEEKGAKFSDYFDHREPWALRALAPRARHAARLEGGGRDARHRARSGDRRGARRQASSPAPSALPAHAPGDKWLRAVADWTWRVKLSITMMIDLLGDLRSACAGGGDRRLRAQPEGPAARGPGGFAPHARPRSRHPHRRQGRGGRCHGQAARHRHALSLPAEERRARARRPSCCASSPSMASISSPSATAPPAARRNASWPRPWRCCRRTRRRPPRSSSPKPAHRSIRPPSWRRASSPISTCRCAARCPSRGACRIRWRNSSRSSRSPSASASTSTMSTSISSAARSMPSSRTR